MNHLKCVSYRSSWCRLRRPQSSLSALNSKIQIPPRIERGPTDILRALDQTVPRNPMSMPYKYQDDPFLLPSKRSEANLYSLSYESGKKMAMWIHKEHENLFPRTLSEPEIKSFMPPAIYTDKSQVSEKLLLKTISEVNISDAVHIYKLMEGNVSNEAKQSLFELLCFYNGDTETLEKSSNERWFFRVKKRKQWQKDPLIEELYEFLTTQDSITASKAHNTQICGYAKWLRGQDAWKLYLKCEKEKVPLNVNTYNYIISQIPVNAEANDSVIVDILYNLLQSMNQRGILPNVRTLNAALKVASSVSTLSTAEQLVKHLFIEFKRLNIKFSLGSFYYAIVVFTRKGDDTYPYFMDILDVVSRENFTIQDPIDNKFFVEAMETASKYYSNKQAGEIVHNLLLTGENNKFLSHSAIEKNYYNSYLSLMLSTNTLQQFMEYYRNVVPGFFLPDFVLMYKIFCSMRPYPPEVLEECLPKYWLDAMTYGLTKCDVCLVAVELMQSIPLPPESPLTAVFTDAALNTWSYITNNIHSRSYNQEQFSAVTMGHITLLLLRGGRTKDAYY
ncbi:PREDICTED: protein PTCD3 homolog, mitochondrial [Dufourea novaeangliae]|uniref:protein PTCD3 homolog, mitochondrial n=1 Tax=Dufourea novaeangliae TaxID=178035 RepID=UPI000767AF22|nr:PREDICTED: protein PTCD3 homolog, mitochondrial [Dufourea novaeangliae]